MECTMCEHCQAPLNPNQNFSFREGFSYHEKCHKCYVCSETNLREAEVFKGVIFCSGCAHRIFQGCATARRTRGKDRLPRGSHRRRSHRTQGKHTLKKHQNGILEMAGLAAASAESSKSSDGTRDTKQTKSLLAPTEIALTAPKPPVEELLKKKKSAGEVIEVGMITEVTQELLKQMRCPVAAELRNPTQRVKSPRKSKKQCSDLRIAELGTSTEIANMALKHRSEQPVIIKSESHTKNTSQSGSLNRESVSRDRDEEWLDSAYSTLKSSTVSNWMDRRLGSLLTLPYRSFKRHILDKSSLVSISTRPENKILQINKIKEIFHHEINDHQKRGLKRLYSTINRRQPKNKLGWLNHGTYNKRCKHSEVSHSYRCMRAQVMKLAGPTKSELAALRARVKSLVSPRLWSFTINRQRCAAITMSQSCGNSGPGSTKVM